MKHCFLLPALVATNWFHGKLSTVDAFPRGAGGCMGGMAAVEGLHLDSSNGRPVVNGTLADGAIRVTVGDVLLDVNTVNDIPIGQDLLVGVEAGDISFRGVLLRLQAPDGVDTTGALIPEANLGPASVCVPPVVGITHTNDDEKTMATGTLRFDEVIDEITLDVTIVFLNAPEGSAYVYSRFSIQTRGLVSESPTSNVSPTVAKPVSQPVTSSAPSPKPNSPIPSKKRKGGKSAKGKGAPKKSKLGKGKGSKNKSRVELPDFCDMLNFRVGQIPPREVYNDMDPHGALCEPNVLDTAKRFPKLSTFVQLVEQAGLEDIFLCAGPFTLLAPSNSAFNALNTKGASELLQPSNLEELQDLLLYHILPRLHLPAELEAGYLDTLLIDNTVKVTLDPIMFNQNAGVVSDNIVACNGAIYILDDVVVPDTSSCTAFDFGNPEHGEQGCTPNVLEEARNNPDLSLAVILFERAELAGIFICPGSFTVLFPTNSAIEMVDPSLIDFLLQPENIFELQNLMLYHVLPGFFPSSGLTNGQLIETLFPGRDVEVTVTPDTIMFNDATVVTSDIEACNGLIYTINQVITFLPPRPTAAPTNAPTRTLTSPTVSPVTSEKAAQP